MDLTYTQDGMFTRFMPQSGAGEDAWREMANKMNGVAAVFNFEVKEVINSLRKAGYKVGKSKPVKMTKKLDKEIDELLAALADVEGQIDCDICGDCHEEDNIPLSCQTGDGE